VKEIELMMNSTRLAGNHNERKVDDEQYKTFVESVVSLLLVIQLHRLALRKKDKLRIRQKAPFSQFPIFLSELNEPVPLLLLSSCANQSLGK
jgi:hypothetical protein